MKQSKYSTTTIPKMPARKRRDSRVSNMIRVSEEVYICLMMKGHTGESFDDVLRKVLGLPNNESNKQSMFLRKVLDEVTSRELRINKTKEIIETMKDSLKPKATK